MDHSAVLQDAWAIMRRTRSLWWLGAISVSQFLAATAMIVIGVIPVVLLTLAVAEPGGTSNGGRLVESGVGWISGHLALAVAILVLVFLLWLASAIVGLAAETGTITQADSAARHSSASVGQGLRDGFRFWWRSAALVSLAVLPSLVYLAIVGFIAFLTVTLPLWRGQDPSTLSTMLIRQSSTPLSLIFSVVSVPLFVLVGLARRFAVVADLTWRPALAAAWRLTKARLADIAIMFAILYGISLLISIVLMVVLGVCALVFGGIAFGVAFAASGGDPTVTISVVIAVLFAMAILVYFVFQAATTVWVSCAWTVAWGRLTGRMAATSEPVEVGVGSHRLEPTVEGGV